MPLNIPADADPPPRTRAPRASTATGRTRTTAADKAAQSAAAVKTERADAVNGLFGMAAFGSIMFKNYHDAGAFTRHGPKISGEVADLAEKDAAVAGVVDYITKVGPYAALLGVSMPLVLQLAVNHNLLPAAPLAELGVTSPETLSAQVQTDMMREQMRVMQEAQQAESDLADMMRQAYEQNAPAADPERATA